MKKILIAICILFSVSLYNSTASAQSVTISVNIDKQPSWGPSGYDYANFYYFPDLDIYYDIANSLFYYSSGGKWISAQYLPNKYRKYDLYSLYKVVINQSNPWNQNKTHKKSYSEYKGDKTQTPIRNSNDSRYNTSKSNNREWVNTQNGNKASDKSSNAKTSDKNTQKTNNSAKNTNNNNNNNNNSRNADNQSQNTRK